MTIPQYQREGWRPNGPGNCRCPNCGATVSTNALARAAHKRTHRIRWDDQRFAGNVYAVIGNITVARISERSAVHEHGTTVFFDVFPAPDAPLRYHRERDGIAMDCFRTLDAAKQWIAEFVQRNPVRL